MPIPVYVWGANVIRSDAFLQHLSRCNWGIERSERTSSALTVVGTTSVLVGALCNWDDTKDNFHHTIMCFLRMETL